MTLFCSTPSNGFQTPNSRLSSSPGSGLCIPHIPTILSDNVMDPHWIPLISWTCHAYCHIRTFASSLLSSYFALLFKLFASGSFWILLSQLRYYILREVPPDAQCKAAIPGTAYIIRTVLVYLSIHLFFIQNILYISTYATEDYIFHSMLYPYIYVVQ